MKCEFWKENVRKVPVYPRRWRKQWDWKLQQRWVHLCRECAHRFRAVLGQYERHPDGVPKPQNFLFYPAILNRFLTGKLNMPTEEPHHHALA